MKPTPKTFEALASEWGPRAKRFFSLVAAQAAVSVRRRLPAVFVGSLLLVSAGAFAIGFGAWLSFAAWSALLASTRLGPGGSALVVAAAHVFLSAILFVAAKRRSRRPIPPAAEVLPAESRRIDEAGRELITLFRDLVVAAKRSISPNEILKPYAGRAVAASAALGFLLALNLFSERKAPHEPLE